MRSSASYPAGPHGRLAQKNGKSGPHCWGREGSTQFAQQFVTALTGPPLVGCVVWSQFIITLILLLYVLLTPVKVLIKVVGHITFTDFIARPISESDVG